jgi:hypothetical protein
LKRRSVLIAVLRGALVAAALTMTGLSIASDRELTDSPDFRVRVQAALRLGKAGPGARPDLEGALRDAHPAVRVAAAAALGNIGDAAAIPALERATKSETSEVVRTAMRETVEKLRSGGAAKSAPTTSLANARYVVNLGTMRNISGMRGADLDGVMRQAARAKAGTIKDAVVFDGMDASVVQKATEKRIPILQVDGNLTKLTQVVGTDGSTVISAKVDMSIRKLPGQTLKGTVSGNASGSNGTRIAASALQELQDRVVGGAVESAMGSMGNELAALSR